MSGCWTSPIISLWLGLKPEQNFFNDCKEVLERTMCVITADFKSTPDPIVISWEHWGMLVIKGHEGQEMTRELGLLSHQEIEMVIPEWWTWWRWLVHSPTAWKTLLEGLKVLTLVPNPIRISPQMHVTCGWWRVLMHKHNNMFMH